MSERADNRDAKPITRRRFVERTSAIAAAAAFSTGLSVARGAHAAGGETLKITYASRPPTVVPSFPPSGITEGSGWVWRLAIL